MLADRRIRWSVAAVCGGALAALIGVAAARAQTEKPFMSVFLAFFLCTVPFLVAGAAALLDPTDHPEAREDSVEDRWLTKASSGAFNDTVMAMGLVLVVTSVLDLPDISTGIFLGLAMLDMSLRYFTLQQREG